VPSIESAPSNTSVPTKTAPANCVICAIDECRGRNGVRSHSTATTAVPPKAPLPAEPVRFAVVAATVSTDHSPFIAVRVVTPCDAMRSPFFRRWPAVIVATIGVAFVPPVMRMPRVVPPMAEPRLRCLMDMVHSFTEKGPVIPQEEGDPAAPPAGPSRYPG
jgi:hypothetical protein